MNKFIKFLLAFAKAILFTLIAVICGYITRHTGYPVNLIICVLLFIYLIYYFYDSINSKGGEE